MITAAPLDPSHALTFILAGAATFTLESEASGVHHTYRIRATTADTYDVELLTGPNNTTDFQHVGALQRRDGVMTFHPAAHWHPYSPSYKALWWTICRLQAGLPTARLAVHHAGMCGACGRALTTPESVKRGMGSVCAERAG